jgi:hypothetical protein
MISESYSSAASKSSHQRCHPQRQPQPARLLTQKILAMLAGSSDLESEKAGGARADSEAGTDGPVWRNPLDPLLMRLAHDYVDDRDLADKLAKLFLVTHILTREKRRMGLGRKSGKGSGSGRSQDQ